MTSILSSVLGEFSQGEQIHQSKVCSILILSRCFLTGRSFSAKKVNKNLKNYPLLSMRGNLEKVFS